MSKCYLYSRVSTSQQTLEQQERTAYEWLKAHNMTVDEVVSDEGVSGGVSYADRKLGRVLLQKAQEGDIIIVSEVSRLGRSMYDLSKLIHTELKPRKLRLVIAGMGIDLNCANITPIDQLILSNFSFAAELEKHLIRERTLSALQVKKQQGVKLGGSSQKWRDSISKQTKEQKEEYRMKRGLTKNERNLQKRDSQALLKIVRLVFRDACKDEDSANWDWSQVNTKEDNRMRIFELMKDYRDIDEEGKLFRRWNFDDDKVKLQVKLATALRNLRNSVLYRKRVEEEYGKTF